MHPPRDIFDITILEEEPFRSEFNARQIQGQGSRAQENKITGSISAQVEDTVGGRDAVKKWFALAFEMKVAPTRHDIALFVEFFWRLKQNLLGDAQRLLKTQQWSLAVHHQRDALRTASKPRQRTISKKPRLSNKELPTIKRSSPSRSAAGAAEVPEPPRKICRLKEPTHLPEQALSGFKIRLPARPNTLALQNATRSAVKYTPSGDNRGLSQAWPKNTHPEPIYAHSSPTMLPLVPTEALTWLKSPTSLPLGGKDKAFIAPATTNINDEDQEMTLCSSLPAAPPTIRYAWPESRMGFPPVWSKGRQEMCETLPSFRSFHGGVYQNGGVAKGYMLSMYGADRDRFLHGGRFIISHGGGGKPENDAGRIDDRVVDQKEEKASVQALLNSYTSQTPLVLLVDHKYPSFPLRLAEKGIYLAALGFYTVVSAWAEYHVLNDTRVVRHKFAFQWCPGQGEPWWILPSASPPVSVDISTPKPVRQCSSCAKLFSQIYTQSWVCCNSKCSAFWETPSGQLSGTLEYEPHFLRLREAVEIPGGFDARLVPEHRVFGPDSENDFTTSFEWSRGWHCLKCGRVSSRYAWEKYQCSHCNDTHPITGRIHTAESLQGLGTIPSALRHCDFVVAFNSGIISLDSRRYNDQDGWAIFQSFLLPNNSGKIHHIRGSPSLNGEADRILEEYQLQASAGTLSFRRYPLKQHAAAGTLLSNYYSQNSGEAYKYVAGTGQTVPLDEAPGAVVHARRLIEARVKATLGMDHAFNEFLSVAYLEKQAMAYHSDDEKGLGPVIAGLSLGSPAVMQFRTSVKPALGQHRAQLSILLQHGDILVMEGAGVQKNYKHTVEPINFRIAVTARYIAPGQHDGAPAPRKRRAV
ncbi:hypothetical protein C8R47DRAFT_109578 [Mycena vitilis]|nr:hypothetical protein C8R47DRAFT_109578 [Mycena vitilis]